jgi:hypothetical protein
VRGGRRLDRRACGPAVRQPVAVLAVLILGLPATPLQALILRLAGSA